MSKFKRIFIFSLIIIALTVSSSCAIDISELTGTSPVERVRLGVMKFESKTYDVTDRQASAITDIFARMLFRSKGIRLLEREKIDNVLAELNLGMSGLVDEQTAVKVGKLVGCDYILLGSVTNLARGSSGIVVPAFVVPVAIGTRKETAKATLDIRIVRVETGEIVFTDTADGTAAKSDTSLTAYGVGLNESEFGGLEGTAIADATSKLAPRIEKALTGEDTLTEIFKADKKSSKSKSKNTASSSKTKSSSSSSSKSKSSKTAASKTSAKEITAASKPSGLTMSYENQSTDPNDVIKTYGLPVDKAQKLREKHKELILLGNKKIAYNGYIDLVNSYDKDYLAAFRAGEVAQNIKDFDNARIWYEKALEINPEYQPAQKAIAKLDKAASRKRR